MSESNFFENIVIQNFKSIRSLHLGCERINLFIGKPNAGKSTILEALSLFCTPYSTEEKPYLSEFIRYDKLSNLFFDQIITSPIEVSSNLGDVEFYYSQANENYAIGLYKNRFNNGDKVPTKETLLVVYLDDDGKVIDVNKIPYNFPVRKYEFQKNDNKDKKSSATVFLQPPFGQNLLRVIESNTEVRKKIVELLEEIGLKMLLDSKNNELFIFKEINGIAYRIPYNLIADTLQQFVFHYAAIESNENSIIIFEEPENHSYPPYIRDLAQTIVSSESNQFFITTHSPYLFNTIVENCPPDELAVFITYMEDYETKVKKLTQEELAELSNYGVDVFFNLNWFVHGEMDSTAS